MRILSLLGVALASMIAAEAHAATLSISNGFAMNKSVVGDRYSWTFGWSGVIVNGTVSTNTSLSLTCVLDEGDQELHCAGQLALGSATHGIRYDATAASGGSRFKLGVGAGTAMKVAFDEWATHLDPSVHGGIIELWPPDDEDDTGGGGGGGGGGGHPGSLILVDDEEGRRWTYDSDWTVILDGATISWNF